jgi:5-methylcytosine-specific restriction endonuclease McrA
MSKRDEWRAITRSKLGGLYRSKSAPEIAAMYNVTPGAVYYRLKFFGLTAEVQNQPKHRGPRRSFMPNKDELAGLYEKMSMRDVAAHYGVSETVVFHRLRDYGVPIRTRSESLTGKKKTLEHRLKMSRERIGKWVGPKNFNWKGGVSTQNKLARSKTAYFEWKNAVLKAANHRCQSCGIEHGSICGHCGHRVMLHAHHIKEFAKNHKLRYEPSNGKALCDRCHMSEHDQKIG